jgi:hypothetical protein
VHPYRKSLLLVAIAWLELLGLTQDRVVGCTGAKAPAAEVFRARGGAETDLVRVERRVVSVECWRIAESVMVFRASIQTERATMTLWDGWLMVMEETSVNSGTPNRRFYDWGLDVAHSMRGAGGVGGLLAIHDDSTEKTCFPVHDGRGNIIALIDERTPTRACGRLRSRRATSSIDPGAVGNQTS